MDEVPVADEPFAMMADDQYCATCKHAQADVHCQGCFCPKHGLLVQGAAMRSVYCLAWERRESHVG
jgi:hypothetical protein